MNSSPENQAEREVFENIEHLVKFYCMPGLIYSTSSQTCRDEFPSSWFEPVLGRGLGDDLDEPAPEPAHLNTAVL